MIKVTLKDKIENTVNNHLIFYEPTNSKSWASSILLRKFYWKQDPDNPIHKANARINFSRSFLTRWKEKHGKITCNYCKKTDLVIEYEGMQVERSVLATIDHVIPISRGGAVFDEKNVVPCCNKCNQKKGNKLLEEFKREF
jgi:5-methylcytosine-specific restriction endonuclease McrA